MEKLYVVASFPGWREGKTKTKIIRFCGLQWIINEADLMWF